MASSKSDERPLSRDEIIAEFNSMRQEQAAREQKIGELDNDRHEHTYGTRGWRVGRMPKRGG